MPTPKVRHLDHRTIERTRHSDKLPAWLEATCVRLDISADEVFDLLRSNTSEQIDQMQPTPDE